jgi:DNA-binding protein HU-beta
VVAPEVEAPAKAPKAPKLKLKAGPEPVVEEATEFAEMDDNSAEVYNRKDLSESIRTTLAASGIAVPSSVALAMCSAYEAVIQEMISSGANVSLTGFGQFKVGVRAGGERRNPSTGEQITVPAAYTVSFKVGRKLKDSVQMLGIPPV